MSSKSSDTASGIAVDHLDADDPISELKGVGPKRSTTLPYSSIESLSRTTADQLLKIDDAKLSPAEAERIMQQANDIMGNGSTAAVEQGEPDTGPESVAVDDLDADSGSDIPDMSEADTVGIVVGMATADAEESMLAGYDDDELMAQFASELTAAGLDPSGEGWTPVILGSGMGRPEVVRYLQQAENHEDVLQESANLDAYESARDAYQARDKRFVEDDIDGLVAVANGEYVGKFVNLAYDAGLPIHTPPMDDDDDPDGLDVSEA